MVHLVIGSSILGLALRLGLFDDLADLHTMLMAAEAHCTLDDYQNFSYLRKAGGKVFEFTLDYNINDNLLSGGYWVLELGERDSNTAQRGAALTSLD